MFIKTTFKFFRDQLEIISYIYTNYIKSKSMLNRILSMTRQKHNTFRHLQTVFVKRKSIYELMTFNLRALFHGRLMLFFKKSASISDYIHFCDSNSLLITLTTLFRKTSLKMLLSLETTLTTLIYIKNSFITDYADNDDIHENMKNSFITEFDDYPVFNTR